MSMVADRRVSVWQNRIHPNVKVGGSGPPLVFLHGAGGHVLDPFLEALAANHTVYAPEHPAFTDGHEDAIAQMDELWDLVFYYRELFDVPDTELQLRMIWSSASTGKFAWPIPDRGLEQRLSSIQAPTMILWGKQDKLVPVAYARDFARPISGATVEVIDQAGHLFPAEYPERVAAMVEDFLR